MPLIVDRPQFLDIVVENCVACRKGCELDISSHDMIRIDIPKQAIQSCIIDFNSSNNNDPPLTGVS
jgi:hypothetical protein